LEPAHRTVVPLVRWLSSAVWAQTVALLVCGLVPVLADLEEPWRFLLEMVRMPQAGV
jgi:hypothetical protein